MPREGSIPKREHLPLPLPKRSLIRESDILSMLKSDGQIGPQARQAGAEAWHYMVVSAQNGLDAHGRSASYLSPPTVAQAAALFKLMEDCVRFVSDTVAKTPIDFNKELGTKLHSYCGEPVFCAQELTLQALSST